MQTKVGNLVQHGHHREGKGTAAWHLPESDALVLQVDPIVLRDLVGDVGEQWDLQLAEASILQGTETA